MTSRIRKGFLASVACALGSSLVCCKDMPIVAIIDGGGTIDGGADAGPDGGPYVGDAGGCRVRDGGLVPAGTWLDPTLGSCALCDPSLNPDGWTVLDGGQICEGLTSRQTFGPLTVLYSGFCGVWDSSLICVAGTAGSGCGSGLGDGDGGEVKSGCVGGFCNDAGWCSIDQNLGWAASCGDSSPPNPCAQGPCCIDAGFEDFVDGGGWCCGLIDGGVKICLPYRAVCYASSDCCEGLTCTGHHAVYDSDAGYGFCE